MQKKMTFACLIFLFSISYQISISVGSIACKNENNNPVDWFIVYKLPTLSHDPDPEVQDGLGYYYMDVNRPAWVKGKQPLNKTGNAISNTLQQIYDNHKSKDVMYLIYNDETPKKKTLTSHGHTKGDVCFDKTSGYWLVHSLPRFPESSNASYRYPNSGRIYGQTFLCVTYPYDMLNHIGEQLLYNYPRIYDANFPDSFLGENPNINKTIHDQHVTSSPWKHSVTLTSLAGEKFTSFAKFSKFDADLYHDWIAPTYKSEIYVECWMNGVGSMDSNCTKPYNTYNIKELKVMDASFRITNDHSKWTVTRHGQWTCIGDINRQESQKMRAGGTVCFNIPPVWQQFNQSIISVQPCPPSGISSHKPRPDPAVIRLNDLVH